MQSFIDYFIWWFKWVLRIKYKSKKNKEVNIIFVQFI